MVAAQRRGHGIRGIARVPPAMRAVRQSPRATSTSCSRGRGRRAGSHGRNARHPRGREQGPPRRARQ
eukprot:10072662-Alexandrium_andersonii.AAC.1